MANDVRFDKRLDAVLLDGFTYWGAPSWARGGNKPMENNVILFQARGSQPAANGRAYDAQISVTQVEVQPQPVAPNDNLARLTHALIVRLRDGRFNQRVAVYRELDAIARSIERETGVAPGSWV